MKSTIRPGCILQVLLLMVITWMLVLWMDASYRQATALKPEDQKEVQK